MDIAALARTCVRRWYVVLIVVLVALAYGLFQYTSAKPLYVASSQMILVSAASQAEDASATTPSPPVDDATGTDSADPSSTPSPEASPTTTLVPPNPLQNIQTTITALVARMSVTPIVISTADGSVAVTVGPVAKGGPLIVVSTTGSSAAAVTAGLAQGQTQVRQQLSALQDDVGAPTLSRFLAVPLGADTPASSTFPSRAKALAVVIAVGVVVAVLLAVLVDAGLGAGGRRSRSRRRAQG